MTAALRAQIRSLQLELATRTAERDQARKNFRRAFAIVQGVYTSLGVRNFVIGGTPYPLDDGDPAMVLQQMRTILRGIPLQVHQMHEASPDVPRVQWHPTVRASRPTMPMELETAPAPMYAATVPMGMDAR